MLLAALAILLTLILVIGIHEGGHACAARFFQIKIKRISLGFGRPLLSRTSKSGCEWIWSLWPLGGYVQLLNTRISPVPASQHPYCFDKKPVWQRLCVLLAGAFANVLVAWVAWTVVYCIGIKNVLPDIQSVTPQSIGAQAGLLPGDRIVAINQKPTVSWRDVGMELMIAWGHQEVLMTVMPQKGGVTQEHMMDLSDVSLRPHDHALLHVLGITPNLSSPVMTTYYSLYHAMLQSGHMVLHTGYFFLVILKQLVTGMIPFSLLLGPLGLFALSVSSFMEGVSSFLYFIALLNSAVAVVNLLPVPGLDGGSLIYALIEGIRGRPVSVAFEVLMHRLAFIVLCVLLVHLFMNDIQRFLGA